MNIWLLEGQLIKPQLLLTNNNRTKAIDIIRYSTHVWPRLKDYKIGILGENNEYCWYTKITIKEASLILTLLMLKQFYKKQNINTQKLHFRRIK